MDEEMAKQLRALANLPEVPSAVSATGVELDSTACNSSLGDLMPSSVLCKHYTHRHIHTDTHTYT